jgi:hypothetical protein
MMLINGHHDVKHPRDLPRRRPPRRWSRATTPGIYSPASRPTAARKDRSAGMPVNASDRTRP